MTPVQIKTTLLARLRKQKKDAEARRDRAQHKYTAVC